MSSTVPAEPLFEKAEPNGTTQACIDHVRQFEACRTIDEQLEWLQNFSEDFNLSTLILCRSPDRAGVDPPAHVPLDIESDKWMNAGLFEAYFRAATNHPIVPGSASCESVIQLIHTITEELYAHNSFATENMLQLLCAHLIDATKRNTVTDAIHLNHLLLLSAMVQPCLSFVEVSTTPLTDETKSQFLTDVLRVLMDFLQAVVASSDPGASDRMRKQVFEAAIESSKRVAEWDAAAAESRASRHADATMAKPPGASLHNTVQARGSTRDYSKFSTGSATFGFELSSQAQAKRDRDAVEALTNCAEKLGQLFVCNDLKSLMAVRRQYEELVASTVAVEPTLSGLPSVAAHGANNSSVDNVAADRGGQRPSKDTAEYETILDMADAWTTARPVTFFQLVRMIESGPGDVRGALLKCCSRLVVDVLDHLLQERQHQGSHSDPDWVNFVAEMEDSLTYVVMNTVNTAASGKNVTVEERETLDHIMEGLSLVAVEYGAVVSELLGVPISLASMPLDDEADKSADVPKSMFVLRTREIVAMLLEKRPIPWHLINWHLALFAKFLHRFQRSWAAVTLDAMRGLLPVLVRVAETLANTFSMAYERSATSTTSMTLHYIIEILDDFALYPQLPKASREVLAQLLAAQPPSRFTHLLRSYMLSVLGGASQTPSGANAALLPRAIDPIWENTDDLVTNSTEPSNTFSWPAAFDVKRHQIRLIEHIRCFFSLLSDSYAAVSSTSTASSSGSPSTAAGTTITTKEIDAMLNPRNGIVIQSLSRPTTRDTFEVQMAVIGILDQQFTTYGSWSVLLADSANGPAFARVLYSGFLRGYFSPLYENTESYQTRSVVLGLLSCLRSLLVFSEDARNDLVLRLGFIETLTHEIDLEESIHFRRRGEQRRTDEVVELHRLSEATRMQRRDVMPPPSSAKPISHVEPPKASLPVAAAASKRPAIPKLSLGNVPPPMYFTSNGDTAEAMSSQILRTVAVADWQTKPPPIPKATANDGAAGTATPSGMLLQLVTHPSQALLLDTTKTKANSDTAGKAAGFQELTPADIIDRALFPSEMLESESAFTEALRKTRRIYADGAVHAHLVLSLMAALLRPSGLVDTQLATPYVAHNERNQNVIFTLEQHLRSPLNAALCAAVVKLAATARERSLQLFLSLLVPDAAFKQRYVIRDTIGAGAYGTVSLCFLSANESDEVVDATSQLVVKLVPIPAASTDRVSSIDVQTEVVIMALHQDMPGMCQFFEVGNTGVHYAIVMRRYSSSLAQWARVMRQRWDGVKSREFCGHVLDIYMQIVDVVLRLHERKVIHYDLKCDNFFLSTSSGVVVGDFGCSLIIRSESDRPAPGRGTEAIRAPECTVPGKFSHMEFSPFASDVWSLGCLLFELATGEFLFNEAVDGNFAAFAERITNPTMPLFNDKANSQLLDAIRGSEDTEQSALHNVIRLQEIINLACVKNPTQRPTVEEFKVKVAAMSQFMREQRTPCETPAESNAVLPAIMSAVDDDSLMEVASYKSDPETSKQISSRQFKLVESVYWLDWDIALQHTRFTDEREVTFETIIEGVCLCSSSQPTVLDLAKNQVTHVLSFDTFDNSPIPSHCESHSLFDAICVLHPQVASRGTPVDTREMSNDDAEVEFARRILAAVEFMQITRVSRGKCAVLPLVVDTIDIAVVLVLCYVHATYGVSVATAAGEIRLKRPQPAAASDQVVTGRDGKKPYASEIAMSVAIVARWEIPSEARVPLAQRSARLCQCLCGRCIYEVPQTAGCRKELVLVVPSPNGAGVDISPSLPDGNDILTGFFLNTMALHAEGITERLFPAGRIPVLVAARNVDVADPSPLFRPRWIHCASPSDAAVVALQCQTCKMPTHIKHADGSQTLVTCLAPPLRALADGIEAFGVDNRVNSWISLSMAY